MDIAEIRKIAKESPGWGFHLDDALDLLDGGDYIGAAYKTGKAAEGWNEYGSGEDEWLESIVGFLLGECTRRLESEVNGDAEREPRAIDKVRKFVSSIQKSPPLYKAQLKIAVSKMDDDGDYLEAVFLAGQAHDRDTWNGQGQVFARIVVEECRRLMEAERDYAIEDARAVS